MRLKRRQMCLKWRQMRCETCQEPRTASKCVTKYAKSLEQHPNALRNILKTLIDGVKSAGGVQMRSNGLEMYFKLRKALHGIGFAPVECV